MISRPSHLHHRDTAVAPLPSWESVEIVRQMKLHRMLAHVLGGSLPGLIDLSKVRRVLDLGWGAGDWVLEMAYHHPDLHVIGIDHSRAVVEYARVRAESQGVENASFASSDFFHLSETSFPLESFDLLHVSFLTGGMAVWGFTGLWRLLLRLRPCSGGVVWC